MNLMDLWKAWTEADRVAQSLERQAAEARLKAVIALHAFQNATTASSRPTDPQPPPVQVLTKSEPDLQRIVVEAAHVPKDSRTRTDLTRAGFKADRHGDWVFVGSSDRIPGKTSYLRSKGIGHTVRPGTG